MDSNEFSEGKRRNIARIMAQKARVAKKLSDEEFDVILGRLLAQDRPLLEKLAKV